MNRICEGRQTCEYVEVVRMEKETSVRKVEQRVEREEEHHNQTCLVAGNSGKRETT